MDEHPSITQPTPEGMRASIAYETNKLRSVMVLLSSAVEFGDPGQVRFQAEQVEKQSTRVAAMSRVFAELYG